jgi:hypothetical protein
MKRRKAVPRAEYKPPWTCLHVSSGRIGGPKNCVYNYECHRCPFDQWLDWTEPEKPGPVRKPKSVSRDFRPEA